jgi:drug/metabolite transporter (DMT)-like permease
MGSLVLDEPITNSLLLGMTLTVGGVIWVIRERRLPTAPEPGGLSEAEIRQSEKIGLGFALLAALCQSSGQLLTRSASADLSAMELSIIRLAAGVVGIMVQLVILKKIAAVATPFRHSHPAITLLIATFLGTYCGVWLMNYGLQNLPVGVASTLNSTSPIFILPLSALVLGEKVSPRAIFGAIVAVAGIAVLALGAAP